MKRVRRPAPYPARPHGLVAVQFALTLPVVLGLFGLAIDLSMFYLRNAQMQQMADAAAAAAAVRLNGTLAGIAAARQDATAMATRTYYNGIYNTVNGGDPTYFQAGSSWSTAALFFSSAPSGAPWLPADSVTDAATAADMMYAMVDTAELSKLSANPGKVSTSFLRLVGAPQSITAVPRAVAGKVGMQVTPLGVCALNTTKYTSRSSSAGNELVEFGFRRGVTYDLLNLNPSGANAQSFLVNPIDDAKVAVPDSSHYSHDFIKPFFCSGTIAYATVRANGSVHVGSLSGIGIHEWLNSRFDDYSGDGCVREAAPPDTNIREFLPANVTWMTTDKPAAKPLVTGSARITIADPLTVPANVAAADYGPLWVFTRPLKFVSASAGGGTVFALSNWGALYPTSTGGAMPSPTTATYQDYPYQNKITVPSGAIKVKDRRRLQVPLLDCSGPVGGTATVLGIGRFYMTSKAQPGAVYAEFTELVAESAIPGQVRRMQ